jgi:nucleoside-diphosphate-sugar epimerase
MVKVLITGGAGFIGSNLSDFLTKKKYKVTIIDNLSTGNKRNIKNKKINFIYSNINNINKLKKIGNFDVIVHLAAMAEILITKKDEKKYFESNIEGLQQVLNFASQKKIKKFIFASSASIYGDTKNIKVKENFNANPKHYYAYTKYIGEKMIEKYCKNNEIKFSILRFFNVYGPKSTAVVARFISQHLQNKPITIYGNGLQKRDFIHVEDLNKIILKLIKTNKGNNQTFNLGSGTAKSIIELKNIIAKNHKHIFLIKRSDDIEISIADISKIKKILNWKPSVSFQKGVNDMIKVDRVKLKNMYLPTIESQKKLLKKFNK